MAAESTFWSMTGDRVRKREGGAWCRDRSRSAVVVGKYTELFLDGQGSSAQRIIKKGDLPIGIDNRTLDLGNARKYGACEYVPGLEQERACGVRTRVWVQDGRICGRVASLKEGDAIEVEGGAWGKGIWVEKKARVGMQSCKESAGKCRQVQEGAGGSKRMQRRCKPERVEWRKERV